MLRLAPDSSVETTTLPAAAFIRRRPDTAATIKNVAENLSF
jgi:hypothetical protein